jgi:RNA polymerase sigma factor (TIGR02999 family)
MQKSDGLTELPAESSRSNKAALDELMPLVYAELRRLARVYLGREHHNLTLQPTAIVHEAYLRLIARETFTLEGRAQFFGMAAKMMRNILVDHARQHHAAKRGGIQYRLSLSKAERFSNKPDVELIALNDALDGLSAIKPLHARIVELRFFGGLTIEETAEVLGTSHATVERNWHFARAWLRRQIEN